MPSNESSPSPEQEDVHGRHSRWIFPPRGRELPLAEQPIIPVPFDPYCGRYAADIPSVVHQAEENGVTPELYAQDDGTYNVVNGHFLCDDCYIKAGTPGSGAGWVAP